MRESIFNRITWTFFLLLGFVAGQEIGIPGLGRNLGTFSIMGRENPLAKRSIRTPVALPPEGQRAGALAEVTGEFRAESVTPFGWRVTSIHKGYATLEGDSNTLEALRDLAGMKALQQAGRSEPDMDEARNLSGVDRVQSWGPRAVTGGVSGRGVLVGFIDSEFDVMHPAFLDGSGRTRFHALWNMKKPGDGSSPFGYGQIKPRAALGSEPSFGWVQGQAHGTSVAGISAGSDRSNAYHGVAPEAVLIGAVSDYSDNQVMNAVEWIFRVADSLGMPCVINMSFGAYSGWPKDGSTIYERYLDAATGPGKIIVQSAGNQGVPKAHVKIPLDPDVPRGTWVNPRSISESLMKFDSQLYLWGEAGKSFSFGLIVMDTVTGSYVTSLERISTTPQVVSRGDTLYWTDPSTGIREPFYYAWYVQPQSVKTDNGRHVVQVVMKARNNRLRLGVTLKGEGTVHGWGWSRINTLESRNIQAFIDGDTRYGINCRATGRNTLAVAAYTSRDGFSNWKGTWVADYPSVKGDLANYSSQGPTVDERLKPEISAPGHYVFSPYSSGIWQGTTSQPRPNYIAIWPDQTTTTGLYQGFSGTSAATPFVTGAVALMLEARRGLAPADVRSILQSTARKDAFTGSVPNARWGAGKIDAAAAVAVLRPSVGGIPTAAPAESIRAFWRQGRLFVEGLPSSVQARGRLLDGRGRQVATLRSSGNGGLALATPIEAGVYVAEIRFDGKARRFPFVLD